MTVVPLRAVRLALKSPPDLVAATTAEAFQQLILGYRLQSGSETEVADRAAGPARVVPPFPFPCHLFRSHPFRPNDRVPDLASQKAGRGAYRGGNRGCWPSVAVPAGGSRM